MIDKMWRLKPTQQVNQLTANFIMNPKPLTLYSIMNSYANYDEDEKTRIRDLAKKTHSKIFDFDYVLSDKIDKEQFEIDILNHFIERRIGYDTITSFQIHLETKLHEILPYYNIMFDALSDYKLFNTGEVIERDLTTNSTSNTNGSNIADMRYSKYPQNQLTDIKDGNYVTDQNYNTNTLDNNTDVDVSTKELIKRSPVDKMKLYESYLKTKNSIMTKLYKDLDVLFYQLVD